MPNRNKLLAALPRTVLQANGKLLEPCELQLEQRLHEPNAPIDHVYFPVRGVISMVNEPNPGEIVEFATIGSEGMAGFPVLLGASSMPSRSLVQVPGEGFRMRATALRQMLEDSPESRDLLLRYTMALVVQIAQVKIGRAHV